VIACPYCGEPSGSRLCPSSGEICDWCCPRCAAIRCARGVMRTVWVAAERIALDLLLVGDSLGDALADWAQAFRSRAGFEPEPPMTEAARAVLEQRLGGPPPLPASHSSTKMYVTELLSGIPRRGRGVSS